MDSLHLQMGGRGLGEEDTSSGMAYIAGNIPVEIEALRPLKATEGER